jgi:hypothetical protein
MSTQRRCELAEFEWAIIEPLLPNKPSGAAHRRRQSAQWYLLAAAYGLVLIHSPASFGINPGAHHHTVNAREPSTGDKARIPSARVQSRHATGRIGLPVS